MRLEEIRAYLEVRLAVAKKDAAESSRLAPNSYSTIYYRSELATLSEILALVNGELE